ncbi:Universal stress protein family protein [Halovenus aranensis]|jgi:nucleotide-binding universal stress UspA family protein|uniref:Universal stress protein family protein n=1 Tax=Halovenus aranensis TaxID=890420 RepID=A0A1G8RXQ6_9EURY|nr:universal stress protein [Halovenus aranensis]SDJ21727.1 Universal stress protein family protein [Halovenus aranensis]
MTIVVPFDDSPLAREALRRATEIKHPTEQVAAVAVIPNENAKYAENRGWIGPDEKFDPETIVSRLSGQVNELAPDASFDYIVVGRYATSGQIASKIRGYAREAGARIVVLGSQNAGRIVSSVGSIGRDVATDKAYDTFIVRSETNSCERLQAG